MVYLQTILVYLVFYILLYHCFKKVSVSRKWIYLLGGIFVFALIAGFRYGVGVDFFSYLSYYEYLRSVGIPMVNFEVGFEYLTRIVSSLNLPSGFYFGLIAFIQLSFICLSLYKDKYVYPYLAFTFVIGCIWLSYFNGLRQIVAFCIWAYSVRYISEKKYIKHYILLLLAFLVHSSAAVLCLFYPLFQIKQQWFVDVRKQVLMLIGALVCMYSSVFQNVLQNFDDLFTAVGYGVYVEDRYSDKLSSSVSLGLGFYITLLLNFIIIIYSNKMKLWLRNGFLNIIYNLFFIGVLLKYAFINSQLIGRLNYYFMGFDFIVGAYFLYYLYCNSKKIIYIVLMLYALTFIAVIYKMEGNSALYIFNFQEDLFYLKKGLMR